MKMIEVPEELMVHVVPFIQESCEIIDGQWGKGRTYDDMVKEGIVVEGVTEFVDMFSQYKVWTHAQEQKRFALEKQEEMRRKKDDRDGIIEVEVECD